MRNFSVNVFLYIALIIEKFSARVNRTSSRKRIWCNPIHPNHRINCDKVICCQFMNNWLSVVRVAESFHLLSGCSIAQQLIFLFSGWTFFRDLRHSPFKRSFSVVCLKSSSVRAMPALNSSGSPHKMRNFCARVIPV